MTIFGREAHFPVGASEWVQLLLILAVIGLSMVRVSGTSTALLGVGAGFASYLYDHHLYLPIVIGIAGMIAMGQGVRVGRAPAGWRAGREILLLASGFMLYEWGRTLFVGDEAEAVAHARDVIAFEQRLGLAIEEPIQAYILRHHALLDGLNWVYSFAFLSLVIGALFYLYVRDERLYRVYRTSLGVSALLALITIALYPLAPPRLVAESGLLDTHNLTGRSHGFVNPFAAMPSLHVGWVALAGFMLSRSTRGPARWVWAIVPVAGMTLTVMATGNHYWVDGLVGSAYAIVPAMLLLRQPVPADLPEATLGGLLARRSPFATSAKLRFSLVSLGSLLAYLVIRQAVDPGFTDYWGYLVAQISLTIVILTWIDEEFFDEGGFSWFTHLVVIVNTWADALGTAAHMYDRYVSYDKFTHFLGGVMLTAAAADIIFAIQRRRKVATTGLRVLTYAIGISVGLGAAWEIYEYFGDILFDTGRHAGAIDTWYDLISDSVGSVVSAVLLWKWRTAFGGYRDEAAVATVSPPEMTTS
ncbi:MAG: phosphatase PAP2 family protein [Thermomicrobiales bacterium]|nr:phosphatase PAP2 family protein [Thermomicrobiales bacterium]